MASIAPTLRRIKHDLQSFLPQQAILDACGDAGYRWRQRKLGPVATIHLFILQVLCFNTAITHLRHLAGMTASPAAYCKARKRLPLKVLQALLRRSGQVLRKSSDEAEGRFCGHRVFITDGSSSIAPDTSASQKAFGQPRGQKPGCGFPVPKLIGLFDAFTGAILEMAVFPLYTHEAAKVHLLHPLLKAGDLLVADRGFCSFVHLALLSMRGLFACFRQHQRRKEHFGPRRRRGGKGSGKHRQKKISSRRIRRLGHNDCLVEYFRPRKPKWMDQAEYDRLPQTLLARELRYAIARPGYRSRIVTIATTLLDPIR